MSGELSYIVRLLRMLETALNGRGFRQESDRLGKVIQRLSQAESIAAGLEALYAVEGWERFALRLMWFAERLKGPAVADPDPEVMQYQVEQLVSDLVSVETGEAITASKPPESHAGEASTDLPDALHAFGAALEELKRSSTDGESFKGLDQTALQDSLARASTLRHAAEGEGNMDVMKFSDSFSYFVTYVIDHSLQNDVRVLNLLDNANVTLQTVMETIGTEDYDSLHQTIELLENPKTLLGND